MIQHAQLIYSRRNVIKTHGPQEEGRRSTIPAMVVPNFGTMEPASAKFLKPGLRVPLPCEVSRITFAGVNDERAQHRIPIPSILDKKDLYTKTKRHLRASSRDQRAQDIESRLDTLQAHLSPTVLQI